MTSPSQQIEGGASKASKPLPKRNMDTLDDPFVTKPNQQPGVRSCESQQTSRSSEHRLNREAPPPAFSIDHLKPAHQQVPQPAHGVMNPVQNSVPARIMALQLVPHLVQFKHIPTRTFHGTGIIYLPQTHVRFSLSVRKLAASINQLRQQNRFNINGRLSSVAPGQTLVMTAVSVRWDLGQDLHVAEYETMVGTDDDLVEVLDIMEKGLHKGIFVAYFDVLASKSGQGVKRKAAEMESEEKSGSGSVTAVGVKSEGAAGMV